MRALCVLSALMFSSVTLFGCDMRIDQGYMTVMDNTVLPKRVGECATIAISSRNKDAFHPICAEIFQFNPVLYRNKLCRVVVDASDKVDMAPCSGYTKDEIQRLFKAVVSESDITTFNSWWAAAIVIPVKAN